MATSTAKLAIEISANASKLRKVLVSSYGDVKTFAKNAAKTLATIGASIGVGVAAGITAIVATVNKYSEQIDRLAKTSSKLGIGVAQLQKLQYQAELTGVSVDTMSMAMQRMVRRVSEAAQGTGAAKKAIAELGLVAEELNQLSPDEQFYKISEAMKDVATQGDKVRLAMQIFDTEGVALVNTMNSNLAQTGAEFDKLGLSITGSSAKMVEEYTDAKTKMSALFSGFGLQLTTQLAAPFTKLLEWINKVIIDIGGMGVAANKFASFMVGSMKVAISGVQTLIAAFTKLENLMLSIENITLLPAIAGEAIASQVQGTPGVVGESTQKSFDNLNKIAQNNADLANNDMIKSLDNLLKSLEDEVTNELDFSGGVEVIKQTNRAMETAANDANIMAESTKKAAESVDVFTKSVTDSSVATQIATAAVVNKKSISSFSSDLSTSKGLNPGFSSFTGGGVDSGFMNNTAAGSIVENKTPNLGSFNINMQTDAGTISGELFGDPTFVKGLKTFTDKQTNTAARMVGR